MFHLMTSRERRRNGRSQPTAVHPGRVDTGPWIFGRKVILPAQTIERIDLEDRVVFVDRTKEEIENAPEFDPERGIDATYQDEIGGYCGRYYSLTRSRARRTRRADALRVLTVSQGGLCGLPRA